MIVSHQLARLRGLAVALVVLALTAGAVLAGDPPPAADPGLENAAEQSGHAVLPVAADEEQAEETDEDAEEDTPEADELSEHEDGDTHGALVSEAAQMDTPDGFDTHGAFVSCVARMNRGQLGPDADLSALVLADVIVECASADEETADTTDAAASADDSPGKSGAAKARQASRGPRGNSPNH